MPRLLLLLAIGLVIYILIYSSIITLVLTGVQLYRDYQIDVGNIHDRLQQIGFSSVPSISNDLWKVNRQEIVVQIQGLKSLPVRRRQA